MDVPVTAAQLRALRIIDKHSASLLAFRTNESTNEVQENVGMALVRKGLCESYLSADGRFVRRVATH